MFLEIKDVVLIAAGQMFEQDNLIFTCCIADCQIACYGAANLIHIDHHEFRIIVEELIEALQPVLPRLVQCADNNNLFLEKLVELLVDRPSGW